MTELRSQLENFIREYDIVVMNKDLTLEDFFNEFNDLDNIETYEIGMDLKDDKLLIVESDNYRPEGHIIINSRKYILGERNPADGNIICYYYDQETVEGIIASHFYEMEYLEYINLNDKHLDSARGHRLYCYDDINPPPNLGKLELQYLQNIPLITTTTDLYLSSAQQGYQCEKEDTEKLLDELYDVDVLNYRNVEIDELGDTEVALELASKMTVESLTIHSGEVWVEEEDVEKILNQLEKDGHVANINQYQYVDEYDDPNPTGLEQIFNAVGAENFAKVMVDAEELYNGFIDVSAFIFIVARNTERNTGISINAPLVKSASKI